MGGSYCFLHSFHIYPHGSIGRGEEKAAKVFGKTKSNDVAPIIENSRTMLPARFVAENLGAKVEWIEKDQKVIITKV